MDPESPWDPETPWSRTFGTPSDLPFLSTPIHRSMSGQPFSYNASPGLGLLEREQRRAHSKHVKAHRPAVIDASYYLQNALGIRNTTSWPKPLLPEVTDRLIVKSNGHKLRSALSKCMEYAVPMDRSSDLREFLDFTVDDLKERKVKLMRQARTGGFDGSNSPAAVPLKSKEVGLKSAMHPQGAPAQSNTDKYHEETDVLDADTQGDADESPFGGALLPLSLKPPNATILKREPSMLLARTHHQADKAALIREDVLLVFPDPLRMPGSFTASLCERPHFEVKYLLSLTMKDVTPPTNSPTTQRCILLRHFEVGLDGIEGIVSGEVIVPETAEWMDMRIARLGALGYEKTGEGAYNKRLEQEQRRAGWGKGKWLFFGVKYRQDEKEQRLGEGRWLCFGSPVEAFEEKPATEQYIEIGGAKQSSGETAPIHEEAFIRESVQLSLGGKPCMDIWDGMDEWDDGVLDEIYNAMANVSLIVETLRLDDCALPSLEDTKLRTSTMDGVVESRKRKSSAVAEHPHKSGVFAEPDLEVKGPLSRENWVSSNEKTS